MGADVPVDENERPKAFVCGWPISHTRSPIIHNYWLKAHAIVGSYEKVAVEPEKLSDHFRDIRSGRWIGGNITLPHKNASFELVDKLDDAARAIGAINTVWVEDGKINATNTDWSGFVESLDEQTPGWDAKATESSALILGAGGAAAGIVYGLLRRGFGKITIANRTLEKAKALTGRFGERVEAVPLEKIEDHSSRISILANTTSLGMSGQPEMPTSVQDMIGKLSRDCVVTDAVYTPLRTPLIALAQKRGLRTANGLGMLLYQAVPGFEKWFGIRPQVTQELWDLILADLGEPAESNRP